jgi:hypothetical protein
MKTYQEFITEALQRSKQIKKFNIFHHGSTDSAIRGIRASGPKPSKEGSEGPGHYVTPSKEKAEKYSIFTAKQRGDRPKTISYRVSPQRIQRVDTIPKGLTSDVRTTPEKPVVHNVRTGHAVMDPEFAKRAMIKPQPGVIRRKK